MFHTGLRKMFPLNLDALNRIIEADRLRWIAFGHFEADECGAMNEWLAVAPQATPAHGQTGCMVSLNDFADRAPHVMADNEVIDLGGKRIRFIDTPHTPHGWDAGVLYEETTRTLLCGDLFTQLGNERAMTDGDVVGPAIAAEDLFKYSSLSPGMGSTIRSLSKLAPRTLALTWSGFRGRWGRRIGGSRRRLRSATVGPGWLRQALTVKSNVRFWHDEHAVGCHASFVFGGPAHTVAVAHSAARNGNRPAPFAGLNPAPDRCPHRRTC
jgi:hypothetical protein